MEATDSLHARTRWLTFATVIAFASLSAHAARIVAIDRAPVSHEATSTHRNGPRGRILASGGEVLAENVAGFEVDVAPAELSRAPWSVDRLAALLGYNDTAVLQGEVMRAASSGTRVLRVSHGVDPEVVRRVRAERHELPGVWVTSITQRRYPFGVLTAHPVGFMGDVDERDLAEPVTYRLGDRVGHDGIEHSWELTLRGESSYASEHRGMTLSTTLDLGLETVAARALSTHVGALVALEVRTGAVLAYVSSPGLDPARFERSRVGEANAARDDADPSRVDLVAGAPVGDERFVEIRDTLHAMSRAESADCRDPSVPIDISRVSFWARQLGFGSFTGLDLRDEATGDVLFANNDLDPRGTPPHGARVVMRVTPLQVAVSFAALVNGGIVYQPRLVSQVLHPDGSVAATMSPVVRSRFAVAPCVRSRVLDCASPSLPRETSTA